MKPFDFIIVGQGIAGSVLAMTCLAHQKKILVIDECASTSSSRVAAGLFNPITGRLMNKTWLADKIFPALLHFYSSVEEVLKSNFFHLLPIYRPFNSAEEQNDWQGKYESEMYRSFVSKIETTSVSWPNVHNPFGGVWLQQCGYLDTNKFLTAVLNHLDEKGSFLREKFDFTSLTFEKKIVAYKDLQADYIIFCEGTQVRNNPYWSQLKFRPVKGEVLQVRAELPKDVILNRNVFCVPTGDEFKVGSTYRHHDTDDLPAAQGVTEIINQMKKWYHGQLDVTQIAAGWRPATYDRKPFIGMHPNFPKMGIFNGLGTKGVSLAPYFAEKLINHIMGNETMPLDVDVMR